MADANAATSTGPHAMPEVGNWTIDSTHSFVTFTVVHFTVALARGIASGPTGAVGIGEATVNAGGDGFPQI